MRTSLATMVKLGNVGERDWKLAAMCSYQSLNVEIIDEPQLDECKLQVAGELTDNDLFMVCGTKPETAETENPDRIYRIYTVESEKLLMCTDDKTADDDPFVMGKVDNPVHWRSGRWHFSATTGKLWSREAPDYILDPTCPFYLEAIARNWSWKEHFMALNARDERFRIFGGLNLHSAAISSKLIQMILHAEITEKERQDLNGRIIALEEERDGYRKETERLIAAIQRIGKIAWNRRQKGRVNGLHSLVTHKDSTVGTCAYQVAENLVEIFNLCQQACPDFFNPDFKIYELNEKLFI